MNLGEIWGAGPEIYSPRSDRHYMNVKRIEEWIDVRFIESGYDGQTVQAICDELGIVDPQGEVNRYEWEMLRKGDVESIHPARAAYLVQRIDGIAATWLISSWLSRGYSYHQYTDSQIMCLLEINRTELTALYENDLSKIGVERIEEITKRFKEEIPR
ncbi:hypothetical protein phiK7B1_154 [Pseudomonas phage phiK7B1]|nr:hypothetical protein phiK7B1_154 [Pseudomonas phage phiK7B1]